MIDELIGEPGAAEKHPELIPLLGDLAKKKLPLVRDRILVSGYAGEVPVRPIVKRVEQWGTIKALGLLCDPNNKVEALQGVFYDNEYVVKVSCNGQALAMLPCELTDSESIIFDPKTKMPIKQKYPD